MLMLKHLILILTTTLLLLSGCSSAKSLTADATAASQEVEEDTPIEPGVPFEFDDPATDLGFTIIYRENSDFSGYSEIFYDNHTKVLYYRYLNNHSGSYITPLYNADGSLRTYEE